MNNLNISKNALIAIIIVGLLCIFGIGRCSYSSKAIGLQNDYKAKLKANQASFDNMWKKIQQVSQVPAEKKEALKEVITAYTSGRGTNGGGMISAVREAVPNLDLSIYDQLVNIITGSRNTWTTNQEELVSIANSYNKTISSPVAQFFLIGSGYQPIDPQIITSSKTEEAFNTGKDDDVNLFNKKAEK